MVWTKHGTQGAAKCVNDLPNAFWPYLWSITERTQGNIEFIVIYDKKHHILTRQHRIYLLYIWYTAPYRRWWRHLRVCSLTDQKYEPVKTFVLVMWTTIHARVYAFHLNLKSLLPFPRYCGIFRLFLLCEKNLQHRRGRRQGRNPMETLLFMYRRKYIGNFLT